MSVIEKRWDFRGLKCLILRHLRMGHLCGYVALPRSHPEWGKHYDEPDISVHGGLTFGRQGKEGTLWDGQELWWYGFDCAHYEDKVPGLPYMEGHLWTVEEVMEEVERMAQQFIDRGSR